MYETSRERAAVGKVVAILTVLLALLFGEQSRSPNKSLTLGG